MEEIETKFLTFKEQETTKKTRVFFIYNKENLLLGKIIFRVGWRKYVFHPENDTVWDDICLADVEKVLRELTAEWKRSVELSKKEDSKWCYENAWWLPQK